MELYIHRFHQDSRAILGHLFVEREFQCFVLEDPSDYIPEGRYKLSIYASPRFRRNVLLLHEVPERTYIEIHAGNTIEDTEGCLLVGLSLKLLPGAAFVGSSRIALDALLKKYKDPCWVTISEELVWKD